MFDATWIQWAQSHRSPLLDGLFVAWTWLGDALFYMLLIPLLYWSVDREKAHRLAVVLLVADWLNGLVKEWVAMPRPDPSLGIVQLVEAEGAGFPSGHAQDSVAAWGWLALEFPRPWTAALAVLMVLGTSASRVYLGVHFPGDVVGGWMLGLAVVVGARLVYTSSLGQGWSERTRALLGFLVPLALWPLFPGGSAERDLGFLIALLTAGSAALRAIPYEPRAPLGRHLTRLAVGYVGFFALALANRAYAPPGLPALFGYALVGGWVTMGAPLVFLRLGMAEPPAPLVRRARQRRIPSIAAASSQTVTRYVAAGCAVAAAVVASALAAPRKEPHPAARSLARSPGGPVIIGHRGAAGLAPENTLPAFERGLREGAAWLELDVHLSADGQPVVIHDPTVDRTTDGHGPVRSLTVAQLQALDAGFRFSPDGQQYPYRGKGITVPTLEEVLRAFPEARLVVEMKTDDPAVADAVVATIRRAGASGRVLLAAFSDRVLERARALAPEALTSTATGEALRLILMHRLGLGSLVRPPGSVLQLPPRYAGVPIVTHAFLRQARRWGVPVHVWTLNDEAEMRRFVAMGVDGIVTDYPDRLARILAERPPR